LYPQLAETVRKESAVFLAEEELLEDTDIGKENTFETFSTFYYVGKRM